MGSRSGANRSPRTHLMAMTATLHTDGTALRETFRSWNAERELLDSQLSESLTALAAYQSHLDDWQQQLAREREELRSAKELFEKGQCETAATSSELDRERESLRASQLELDRQSAELKSARDLVEREHDELLAAQQQLKQDHEATGAKQTELERTRQELQSAESDVKRDRDELRAARNQLERDRAAAEKGESDVSVTLSAELNAARDKISALTISLLSRTEELRTLDSRRAEVATELELASAREKEFKTALDEHKKRAEQEKVHWKEELRHLRELLERRAEVAAAEERITQVVEQPAPVAPPQPTVSYTTAQAAARANPVLGSIVQQFDKLRQQRASDRHLANKPR